MGLFDTVAIEFVAITCYKCGLIFGIESSRNETLTKSHESFWCPNGHSQAYLGKTAEQKRIEELERETRELKSSRDFWNDQAKSANATVEHQNRRINGYKGAVARVRRRVAKGRCPCCSQQFKDLKQHMAAVHPHWDPDTAAERLAEKTAEKK